MASLLLCHFIAAFAALGMPLFLPMVLPTLGAYRFRLGRHFIYLPTFLCTALAARFWGQFADKWQTPLSITSTAPGLAARFALCGFGRQSDNVCVGLIVQGTFGGTMAASMLPIKSN
ncbi:hypothetical protein OK016_24855 [Vibrio chagasii]|nr:hypothetical protein [Vibrio chagasii]